MSYCTMTAFESSPIASKENQENNGKLKRVVSAKLSIEDYNSLQQVSDVAFQYGRIKEPTKSELVRFLVTLLLSTIKEEYKRRNLPALGE
jgi:hypothetical protein